MIMAKGKENKAPNHELPGRGEKLVRNRRSLAGPLGSASNATKKKRVVKRGNSNMCETSTNFLENRLKAFI